MRDEVNIFPNVHTFNIQVNAYSKSGKLDDAKHIIEMINDRGEYPDIVTYTSLMQAYCSRGQMDEALDVLNTIKSKKMMPTYVTYNILLDSYCRQLKLDIAMDLYRNMLCEGLEPTVETHGILPLGYVGWRPPLSRLTTLQPLRKLGPSVCEKGEDLKRNRVIIGARRRGRTSGDVVSSPATLHNYKIKETFSLPTVALPRDGEMEDIDEEPPTARASSQFQPRDQRFKRLWTCGKKRTRLLKPVLRTRKSTRKNPGAQSWIELAKLRGRQRTPETRSRGPHSGTASERRKRPRPKPTLKRESKRRKPN
ncbi:hypothetical protein AgCh_023076 [Apium graveolens]